MGQLLGEKARASKAQEAEVKFKEMCNNINKMGLDILKLLRHPQATTEQIMEAHRAYKHVYSTFDDAVTVLRERYPPPKGHHWRTYAWNKSIKELIP